MPYEKLKSENYSNIGGINRKISTYITGPNECLNLQNMDFKTIGSVGSFMGQTNYALSSSSALTGIADFYFNSVTFGFGGNSYFTIATDNYNFCNITGGTFFKLTRYLFVNNNNQMGFARSDRLYMANQYDFNIWPAAGNGSTATKDAPDAATYSLFFTNAMQYSLPSPDWDFSNLFIGGVSGGGGFTGNVIMAAAFVRSDGMIGPAAYCTFALTHGYTRIYFNLPTFGDQTVTGVTLNYTDFNINGMYLWYGNAGNLPIYRQNQFASDLGPWTSIFGGPTYILAYNASPYTDSRLPESYQGTFFELGQAGANGAPLNPGQTFGFSPNPSCLDIFNNQMFFGGFAHNPDTIWYSQIGDYEKRDFDGSFDVRANDGDIVSCIKAYFTQLIIFKINAVSALSGTDPANFVLTDVTDQYGCIATNAACVFENRLWFLDKKGIAEFNGANTQIVSNKVQYVFETMNTTAARTLAHMVHVKERNEVWTAFPTSNQTVYCDTVVIYDYLADAWTVVKPSSFMTCLTTTTRGVAKGNVLYGSQIGNAYSYGPSFFYSPVGNTSGTGLTTIFQSRFIGDMGHSVEKMFRRLYLDANVVNVDATGFSAFVTVNLYVNQNQGTPPASATPDYTTTMRLNNFQNRIDFGLSGRDISVEIVYGGGAFLKINGFTIEYRFQRAV